jgi:hypothetical protein
MGVEKLYKDDIKDTSEPVKGEIHLEGEDFEYEYFLLPVIGPSKVETEKHIISRLGNRIQNGKKCLDIDEELVATNINNEDYSSVVFIKNKNHDDLASGTMQYFDWCNKGKPQVWLNDLCRVATEKQSVSPVKALLTVFEMIATKYVKGVRYVYLMVDKEHPEEAVVLTKIYGKYGYTATEKCDMEGEDEYILMRKKIDRKYVKKQSVRTSHKKARSKTLKTFSQEKSKSKTPPKN